MKILVCCLIILGIFTGFSFAENLAVIVNESCPVITDSKTNLEIKEVKDIYLGKTRMWQGVLIKAVNQKEALPVFLKKACGMGVNDYKYLWVKQELEMGMSAPKVLETSQEVISFVQYNKTGIGYVLESEAKLGKGIKIALILTE